MRLITDTIIQQSLPSFNISSLLSAAIFALSGRFVLLVANSGGSTRGNFIKFSLTPCIKCILDGNERLLMLTVNWFFYRKNVKKACI